MPFAFVIWPLAGSARLPSAWQSLPAPPASCAGTDPSTARCKAFPLSHRPAAPGPPGRSSSPFSKPWLQSPAGPFAPPGAQRAGSHARGNQALSLTPSSAHPCPREGTRSSRQPLVAGPAVPEVANVSCTRAGGVRGGSAWLLGQALLSLSRSSSLSQQAAASPARRGFVLFLLWLEK